MPRCRYAGWTAGRGTLTVSDSTLSGNRAIATFGGGFGGG
jgi:hypothetical protein